MIAMKVTNDIIEQRAAIKGWITSRVGNMIEVYIDGLKLTWYEHNGISSLAYDANWLVRYDEALFLQTATVNIREG